MYIRNSKLQSKTELNMLHTFQSYMYCMPDAFFTQWTLKKILIHIYQKEILMFTESEGGGIENPGPGLR